MPKLVVSAEGPEAWESWRGAFAQVAPDLDVFSWYDASRDPESAEYALVFEPAPGDMARLAQMRAVLSVSAGVSHLVKRPDFLDNVPLVRMGSDETIRLMADYVIWATIGLLRDARRWALQQEQRVWERNPAFRSIEGTRIGVLGHGHLGAAVAQRLVRVGAVVSAWSRTPHQARDVTLFHGRDGLDAFVSGVDILVNILPSTSETVGLIDAALLGRLPRGAGVINVGRGEQVVQNDLIAMLDSGHLCGAVIDVVPHEPLERASSLWAHERVTLTPHVASEASREGQARYVAESIREIEAGRMPALLYRPERGY